MIDSFLSYTRKDIFPRYQRVIFTSHPWIAAVASLLFASGYVKTSSGLKYYDVINLLVTYDTVVMGFCVTAITICFTFSKRFSSVLCKSRDSGSGFSAFEDLIFVFSWTAIIHLFSIVISFFAIIFYGNFPMNFPAGVLFELKVFIFSFFHIYSFLQFFVAVITVHQVAMIYAMVVKSE